MSAATWLSLVLAAAGCTGLVLAGRGRWEGWAIGLLVQPVWAVFAVVTEAYGLLVTCLMYGAVYARNIHQWRHRALEIEQVRDGAKVPQEGVTTPESEAAPLSP